MPPSQRYGYEMGLIVEAVDGVEERGGLKHSQKECVLQTDHPRG